MDGGVGMGGEVWLGRWRGHGWVARFNLDGGVGMVVGGYLSPSLCLSHSSPFLSGCSGWRCTEISAWGARFRWLRWGISRALFVSLTCPPLSSIALAMLRDSDIGGGISVVAVGSDLRLWSCGFTPLERERGRQRRLQRKGELEKQRG